MNYVLSNEEQDKLLLNNVITATELSRLDKQQFSLLGGRVVLYWAECEAVIQGVEWCLSHTTLTVLELLPSAALLPGRVLNKQF